MANIGTVVGLIKSIMGIKTEEIQEQVNDWLEENITNPDSPPLDRALSSSSAAAPADMVGDLKSAIELYTGNGPIEMTNGAYYNLSGTSVTIGSPTSYTTKKYALVACSAGDAFTVSGKGGSSAQPWGFVDSNGIILSREGNSSDKTLTNKVVVAPANAAYLILNNDKSNTSVSYYGQYVVEIAKEAKNGLLLRFR